MQGQLVEPVSAPHPVAKRAALIVAPFAPHVDVVADQEHSSSAEQGVDVVIAAHFAAEYALAEPHAA